VRTFGVLDTHSTQRDERLLPPCDDLRVSYPVTDELSSAERAFMINATEIDILPGVRGDLEEPLASAGPAELAAILLPLIDRGWIEVSRLVPWTAPDGNPGLQPGPSIPGQDLPALLTDADNWEYPDDGEWLGRLTLVLTEAGQQIPR
jgi:hypothetical protein